MKTQSALIFGAGAIGRGFIAPLLTKYGFEIAFVDVNRVLVERLREAGKYRVAITGQDQYEMVTVKPQAVFHLDEAMDVVGDYPLIFSCVGPRNSLNLSPLFEKAACVISCENDRQSANQLRMLSGNPNIFFGIPDVITSSTAPPHLLVEDRLTVVTEKGELMVEHGNDRLPDDIRQLDAADLDEQWACKLYLHNTPHAVVSYLGWAKGYEYVHEAMAHPEISRVVAGAMDEAKSGIIVAGLVRKDLADWYAKKELLRFSNSLLYDPIARVSREPLRKLVKGERLVGAAHLAILGGVRPDNLVRGIRAALNYDNASDSDVCLSILRESIGISGVLDLVVGLDRDDPLYRMIVNKPLLSPTYT